MSKSINNLIVMFVGLVLMFFLSPFAEMYALIPGAIGIGFGIRALVLQSRGR